MAKNKAIKKNAFKKDLKELKNKYEKLLRKYSVAKTKNATLKAVLAEVDAVVDKKMAKSRAKIDHLKKCLADCKKKAKAEKQDIVVEIITAVVPEEEIVAEEMITEEPETEQEEGVVSEVEESDEDDEWDGDDEWDDEEESAEDEEWDDEEESTDDDESDGDDELEHDAPVEAKKSKLDELFGDKDDLTKMKGIGKVVEAKLNAFGITTFAQIAKFTPSDEEQINDMIGFFKGRVRKEEWVIQAKKFVADNEK